VIREIKGLSGFCLSNPQNLINPINHGSDKKPSNYHLLAQLKQTRTRLGG
jgi:hypothetical protein